MQRFYFLFSWWDADKELGLGTYESIRQIATNPLIFTCDPEVLQESDSDGNTKESIPNQGKYYYWNKINRNWIRMSTPKCSYDPMIPLPTPLSANPNAATVLLICKDGLKYLDNIAYMSDLKHRLAQEVRGLFIDALGMSPPAWMFTSLLLTTRVSQSRRSTLIFSFSPYLSWSIVDTPERYLS